MKLVEYENKLGFRQKSLVKNGDRPEWGIHLSPPDVNQLDWDAIKLNLHNLLLDKDLLSIEDVQQRQQEFVSVIVTTLKKPLLRLYQQEAENG